VLDTTYFFAASIVRAKGSIQGCIHQTSLPSAPAPPRSLHHFVRHPAEEEGIGLAEVLDRVTM
jgi:hypothetical protein